MEFLKTYLYCYECSLQFDAKNVFDVHLSVVHGEKLNEKQEPDSQPSVIHEVKYLGNDSPHVLILNKSFLL